MRPQHLRHAWVVPAAAAMLAAPPLWAQVQPATGSADVLGAQVLNLMLGLGVVLALIAACAWLARRLAPRTLAASGVLRVIAGAAVGQRERVVVVEVGETWLVLGVAAGSVNALHQMPRAAVPELAPASLPAFAARLKQALEKRNAHHNA